MDIKTIIKTVDSSSFVVYMFIRESLNDEGKYRGTIADICSGTQLTDRTVVKAIKRLENFNLISRKITPKKPTVYTINSDF